MKIAVELQQVRDHRGISDCRNPRQSTIDNHFCFAKGICARSVMDRRRDLGSIGDLLDMSNVPLVTVEDFDFKPFVFVYKNKIAHWRPTRFRAVSASHREAVRNDRRAFNYCVGSACY